MAIINRRFAPRWSILMIDLFFCVLAMSLAFLLRFNFHTSEIGTYPFQHILILTLVINTTAFCIFKTYSGIVRYTSVEDAGRIFIVNSLSCLAFLFIERFNVISNAGQDLFPLSVLLIYYLAVNFLLISYRVVIKHVYFLTLNFKKKTVKAVLYNAQPEGLLVQKMISGNPKSEIKIITFLEDNEKLIGKVIENIPVVRANKRTLEKLKRNGLELLILADPLLGKQRLNELVDICLDLNIRVQQVPPSKKWLNNKLEVDQLKNINIEQLLEREVIQIGNHKLGAELKGKKILVTGAAGSIGSEIVRQVLQHDPAIVIACDIAETPLHELSLSFPKGTKVKMFIGNVCDRMRMEQIYDIYAPEIVYHAAAYKHVPLMEEHPSAAVLNNVLGTQILAELAVMNHVEKFVMVSTDKAVNPTNVMGASKRISEIFIQSYSNFIAQQNNAKRHISRSKKNDTKFITTRFGNVLGSNGSVIPRFRKQLEEGGPITITHPDITRYFMTIPEACQLVLEAGAMGKGGEIFVFDMGSPVKIVDLAKKMIRLSGKVPYRDIDLVFTGLRPGEKLYEELLNNAENTLPTYHNKILIANVRTYDFTAVCNHIHDLIDLAQKHFVMETVAKMKEMVPEFKSNNSIFEQIDQIDQDQL